MSRLSLVQKCLIVGSISFSVGAFAANTSEHVVSQKKRKYSPTDLTINTGDTIKVVNDDVFLHHTFVDAPNFKFDSGSMEEGDTTKITFSEAGSYQIKCAIHPRMNLNVTVQ